MEEAGNPAPEFKQQDFMVLATIRQRMNVVLPDSISNSTSRGQVTGQVTGKERGNETGSETGNGKEQARSWQGVGKELGVDFNILKSIADYCVEARSLSEIAEHLGLSDRYKMKKKYIDPLLGKYFEMTIPDSLNNPNQKYYLTELGKLLINVD